MPTIGRPSLRRFRKKASRATDATALSVAREITELYRRHSNRRGVDRPRCIVRLLGAPPGVGKTITQRVARDLSKPSISASDLSSTRSKYIGETEKNLDRIFDRAERSGAVLHLDEADALFGSRSNVGDAHDRFANLDTNHLLRRIEEFDGLVVLETNLRSRIDAALLRRSTRIVVWPRTSPAKRLRIWKRPLRG